MRRLTISLALAVLVIVASVASLRAEPATVIHIPLVQRPAAVYLPMLACPDNDGTINMIPPVDSLPPMPD